MNIQTFGHTEFQIMVERHDSQIITTSMKVAEFFGKQHKDVLRAIRNLQCSDEFNQRNFAQCLKINELANGKSEPYFEMTKNGFIFLVMGFTGKKAARIKEAYINAFDWMAEQLQSEVFSVTAELNAVTRDYVRAEIKASDCGRGLRQWRELKPDLENKMEELKAIAQMPLKLH
ncbi:Rha family phage regulatory protein [Oceanisphaera litoralis]|uniref:Rha family transcriptional regulator n=1 Tax=Oceanisphaera litoralis TaxID=225144 RepID=UPI00195CE75B|nr:Rha family transcriptional regulator [Oceanisphaera litoralis]MBM7455189.1 Rha family phage regulatory protein [Oceanisphaera litoralis]